MATLESPPNRVKEALIFSKPNRLVGLSRFLFAAALLALLAPVRAFADRDQNETLLEGKHKHGDYGFYFSVHDPWDPQFDERDLGKFDSGTLAYPIGFKMRVRAARRLLIEGDFSYYRRGENVSPFITVLATPKFDGLVLSGSLQGVLRRSGLARPYAGLGFAFVSLSRDLVVDLNEAIPELDDASPDRFQLGSWKEIDLGLLGTVGVDFKLGTRAFPFVEARYVRGKFGIDKIRVGGFEYDPSEVGVPSTYDFSGPSVLLGLKIHF